jgi:hypothetical protein
MASFRVDVHKLIGGPQYRMDRNNNSNTESGLRASVKIQKLTRLCVRTLEHVMN